MKYYIQQKQTIHGLEYSFLLSNCKRKWVLAEPYALSFKNKDDALNELKKYKKAKLVKY
jgi:hypothetical protein